jgi:hypothetical protein
MKRDYLIAETRVYPHDGGVHSTLYSRVVTRACEALGGPRQLAERIGVSAPMVRAWMTGALSPPPRYFFKVVDILHEAEPSSPASLNPLDQESPGKRTASE